MSVECACAARLSARPTTSAGAPFRVRNELISRTTASSLGPRAAPLEAAFAATTESASARAPRMSDTPSKSTTTLRIGRFPDIKRLRESNGRRRRRPGLQLQFSIVFENYGPIYGEEIRAQRPLRRAKHRVAHDCRRTAAPRSRRGSAFPVREPLRLHCVSLRGVAQPG